MKKEIEYMKYLINKEKVCSLDKEERLELQRLIQKYGYPQY